MILDTTPSPHHPWVTAVVGDLTHPETVLGAARAVAHGEAALVAVVMGVITVSAGGIIRDILAGEPSILLRREIYVTAAALGATVFVLSEPWLGAYAGIAGFAAGFGLRAFALLSGWSLPPFRGGIWRRAEGE